MVFHIAIGNQDLQFVYLVHHNCLGSNGEWFVPFDSDTVLGFRLMCATLKESCSCYIKAVQQDQLGLVDRYMWQVALSNLGMALEIPKAQSEHWGDFVLGKELWSVDLNIQ